MSESLIGEQCEWIAQVAHQKWAMWANRSGRSPKMSDHERFAQVAQRKWAIVSESLRSLTKKEWMSESLIFWSELLIRSFLDKKLAIRSEIKWVNSQPCLHSTSPHPALRLAVQNGEWVRWWWVCVLCGECVCGEWEASEWWVCCVVSVLCGELVWVCEPVLSVWICGEWVVWRVFVVSMYMWWVFVVSVCGECVWWVWVISVCVWT